jgi:hypothetical protein
MTWQAAHAFCSQQNGSLANFTEVQNIYMTQSASNKSNVTGVPEINTTQPVSNKSNSAGEIKTTPSYMSSSISTGSKGRNLMAQHFSNSSNSFDVSDINMTQVNNGGRYWIGGPQIEVHAPQDPLEGWYWFGGTQFNDNNRREIYGKLSYSVSGEEENCAVIRTCTEGIWEDSPCSAHHSFVCQQRGGSGSSGNIKVLSKFKRLKIQSFYP